MCKICQTMIGCSCYCKKEWRSSEFNEAKKAAEPFCSKCNHAIQS